MSQDELDISLGTEPQANVPMLKNASSDDRMLRDSARNPDMIAGPEASFARPGGKPTTRIDSKGEPVTAAKTSTGPRTVLGRRRSSRNALKDGILSKVLILDSESRGDYRVLLHGLQEELRPDGTLESLLVEALAAVLWRKRRLLGAETAEIARVRLRNGLEVTEILLREAWDRQREGETKGGMLRPSSNPFLIREAIGILGRIRTLLKESPDYVPGGEIWLLTKLYGKDNNDEPGSWIFRRYVLLSVKITDALEKKEDPSVIETLKQKMIELLDMAIEFSEEDESMSKIMHERNQHYGMQAGVVLPEDRADRFIRYEAHLTREFDRVLNQLDRVQHMRRCRVEPPILEQSPSS